MKHSERIILLSCLLGAMYIFINPSLVSGACREAVNLCLNTAIPCLFPFMIIMNIIGSLEIKAKSKSFFGTLSQKVLKLPVSLLPICIIGLFGGAPAGAAAISKAYENGLCSKEQAENAAILCNNCSTAFILGICADVLDSEKTAFIILIANLLSVVTSYFLTKQNKEHSPPNTTENADKTSHSFSFTRSITSSASTMLNLCSYIVFFFTFASVISDLLSDASIPLFKSTIFKSLIMSVLEMTSGVMSCMNLSGNERIIAVAFAVSFTGISVIFQVKDILNKHGLSVKRYLYSKLLCALLCPLYTILFLLTVPTSILCISSTAKSNVYFSPKELLLSSITLSLALLLLCCLLIVDKKHKK